MPNLEGEEKVIKSNIKVSPPSCDSLYPALRGPQVPPPQVENLSGSQDCSKNIEKNNMTMFVYCLDESITVIFQDVIAVLPVSPSISVECPTVLNAHTKSLTSNSPKSQGINIILKSSSPLSGSKCPSPQNKGLIPPVSPKPSKFLAWQTKVPFSSSILC